MQNPLRLNKIYGFENRKTVKTVRKKNYGFKIQNRSEKIYGFENRKQKNLRF